MSEKSRDLNEEECIQYSQPISLSPLGSPIPENSPPSIRPRKYTGQKGNFRSVKEIDPKYRHIFSYPYFNFVQSAVMDDALYSNKSMVVCAPTGSGKTVIFEMAIVQLLMELEDKNYTDDYKIIYMAPVKALCTERITEWYSKYMKLGLLCIEVTGDTDVDFSQLQPYRIIITTPEKWDLITRRCNDLSLVKLFLIDEVHSLNDESRGPVLEAVVSRVKTVQCSIQWCVRLVAVSATISNPEDVATWLGGSQAVHYKFGDECRPVKLNRVVEGYPCSPGTSIFKFDIILNYKLWPVIQKYYNGKPTLIFCNTRKSVMFTAETLSKEITVGFSPEQRAKLTTIASSIRNKKLQSLVLSGVGCHHAGLLLDERNAIERAFRNRDLPILITTTTLAMGVNLPAHLVIIKNTQQYVNGAYKEYSISTVLQMIGRAGRPQYDREATAVIMTRLQDKSRYQSLVGGCEPLQSYLHKRLAENINSEVALGTIRDVAQCVQWLNSTFLRVRAVKDPKRYLGLPQTATEQLISKKIEELCIRAMNGLQSSGLITMDELAWIESTEAGRLMSMHYLDLETMKLIMKIDGDASLDRLLWLICESHELSDMYLRTDERRCLNTLNRNNNSSTIRYQMKGKITTREMKLNCIIQAVLGCLPIPDPSLNQEALKIMRIADRVCKCLVSYITRPNFISDKPKFYSAILNSITLAKCITAHLWENSLYVSRQLKGIGPTFSTLLVTAGKTNFMLLEESHPRDLERIINKGPPVGNILRKQISLLPKYSINITPLNEQTAKIQLLLLNQAYLAENIEHLTAGAAHKCYIVVGDSENFLLYFSSFKDSDLINVYDGCLSFEISRKHSCKHKITAHCVSSSFVGIDRQCEYFFQDINPFSNKDISHNKIPQTINPKIQTHTDKEGCDRKRKINNKKSIPYVEKKKRESIEDFLTKKEPFERNIKCLIGNSNISMENNQKIPEKSESLEVKCDIISNNQKAVDNEFAYQIDEDDFLEDFDYEEVDDEKIDELLNGIENEVNRPSTSASSHMYIQKTKQDHYTNSSKRLKTNDYKEPKNKSNMKNNFTFIDRIEKNIENDNDNMTNKTTGLSEAVKNHIQQYLRETKSNMKCIGTNLSELNKNLNTDTPNFTSEEKNEVDDNDNFRPEIIDLTVSETEKYNCPTKNYNSEEIRSKALGSETVENTDGDITHEVAEIFLEHNEIDSIEIENDRAGTEIIDEEMFNNKEKPQNECLRLSHFNENPKKDLKTTDIQLTLRTSPDTQKRSTQNSNVVCIGSDFETRLYDQDSVKDPEAIPGTCSQKPLNTYRTQENESRTSLYQNFQSPLNPTEYNLDINDRNMKNEGSFKDIRKYSYNEVKTISFHKENITRICTLNVALDVTDIVHTNNEPIISEYNFDAKKETNESTSYYKKDSNTPTDLKTDGSKTFIKSDYSYEFNTKHQIREVKKTDKIAHEKAQNTNQIIQGEDKKTTIRDILMKYNKNDPIQSCSKNVETESLLGTYQIERSELKPRRKYRISDLEKIDVTLPASLIPSQNTNNTLSFETKTEPNLHFTNLEEIQDEIITNNTNDNHNDSSTDTNEDCNKLYLEETNLNLECELTVNDSFNFDEAILDPKTLLQTNSNNEVIIPPPAEFCDNSPDASPQINFPNNDSVYDPQHSALDDNNEVSPTSFNDEIKDIFTSNFSQYSNFAVHNQSSSGIFSPSVNNRRDLVKSRSYKLSQFKFNRKRMFKK